MNRTLYLLLGIVAVAAAALSFDALHGLALRCGFTKWLAPLLPVVVDAGAGAGAVAWLRGRPGPGRAFGRWLALALLAASVAGNALSHALAAYSLRPHWGVVVAVSATAPAVLGAVVHLAVLVGGAGGGSPQTSPARRLQPVAATTPPVEPATTVRELVEQVQQDRAPDPIAEAAPVEADPLDRVRELVQSGAGRGTVARELDTTPTKARALIDQVRAEPAGVKGAARR